MGQGKTESKAQIHETSYGLGITGQTFKDTNIKANHQWSSLSTSQREYDCSQNNPLLLDKTDSLRNVAFSNVSESGKQCQIPTGIVDGREIFGEKVADGERLPLVAKDLGSCDLYPQSLKHNPNGRFVVVRGDGEYIIYTALTWRNKSFGSALQVVWSLDGEFIVRENPSRIRIFNKSFKEKKTIRPTFSAESIFGGALLAVASNDFICFYDWDDCHLIRQIDVSAKNIYWSDNGDLVAIPSDNYFYILKYNLENVSAYLGSGTRVDEQGLEDAFELVYEINERV